MTDGVRGTKEKQKLVRWLLWLGVAGACLIATVKVIFVGFSADEEYQLLLTYRLATGDKLFREVWDTLQTSAFYGQMFTWIYLKIFHTTTGLLLFLRLCGVATQGAVSLFLFFTLKRHLKADSALLLSATFFCTYAKLVAMPEFSNLQTWGLTVMICLLWRVMESYEEAGQELHGEKCGRAGERNRREMALLILAALFFCVAILASACMILIPIVAAFLYRMQQGGGVRRNLIFWGTCLVCGLAYVAGLLIMDGPSDLWFGIRGLLAGDDTHASGALLNGNGKVTEYLQEAGSVCTFLVATLGMALLISWIFSRVKKEQSRLWMPLWLGLSYGVTFVYWFIKRSGYEGMKLHYPVLAILGVFAYFSLRGQEKCFEAAFGKNKEDQRESFDPVKKRALLPAVYGILLGMGVFVNVLCFSNVGLICNLTFLSTSALWGMVLLVTLMEAGSVGQERDERVIRAGMIVGQERDKQVISAGSTRGKEAALAYVLSFFAVAVLGTALTLNYGPSGSTILDLRGAGRMQDGPSKGTIVARQIANFYGVNEQTFREVVKEGSNVLIVTSFFHNQSLTTMYMLNDVKISHYTVNSTPTYGEQLLSYWERYPERKPDCIIINGDSCPAEDYQWAMELIEGYGDMELRQIYSTYFYSKPEYVN
ncbi:MAG: hypothetical protein IKQ25_14190 [Lachnospiraceae bacterium]|nr:hypothetical protein [Lachnospiraceae bacterium]